MSEEIEYTLGSGNIFADLGVKNAQEALDKSRLARSIRRQIQARGLTQAQAAKLMGATQPKVSAILGGKLRDFTLDRLIRFNRALQCQVEIVIHEPPSEHPPDEEPPARPTDGRAEDEKELLARATVKASEPALRKIWDTPEEDETWQDL